MADGNTRRTPLSTLWTFEDASLEEVTDAANVKLTEIAELGGTVVSGPDVTPTAIRVDPDDADLTSYLAQMVFHIPPQEDPA